MLDMTNEPDMMFRVVGAGFTLCCLMVILFLMFGKRSAGELIVGVLAAIVSIGTIYADAKLDKITFEENVAFLKSVSETMSHRKLADPELSKFGPNATGAVVYGEVGSRRNLYCVELTDKSPEAYLQYSELHGPRQIEPKFCDFHSAT
jgi:hypothetical protein